MDKHLMTSNNIPEIKMTLYVWRSKLNFDSRFQRTGICSTCLNCARPFWSFKVVQCLHVGGTNPFIFTAFRSGKCKPWTAMNPQQPQLYTYIIHIYIYRESRTLQIFLPCPIIEITLSWSVLTQCRFKIILHLNEKQYGHKSQLNKNVTYANS